MQEQPYDLCRYYIENGRYLKENTYDETNALIIDMKSPRRDRRFLLNEFNSIKNYDHKLMTFRMQLGSGFRGSDRHRDFRDTVAMYFDRSENKEEANFWKSQPILDVEKYRQQAWPY